jgi:hypothetical protein
MVSPKKWWEAKLRRIEYSQGHEIHPYFSFFIPFSKQPNPEADV